MRINYLNQIWRILLCASLSLVLGCSHQIELIQNRDNPASNEDKSETRRLPSKEDALKQKLSNTGQVINHLSESHVKTLITKPVSSAFNLVFLTLNTAKQLATDTTLSGISFPRLNKQQGTKTENVAGMDLVEWEESLTQITGRETNFGRLELLIDGEAFFKRFQQSVNQAQQRINIRTYIFDNDDYAIDLADQLKQRSKNIQIKMLYDGIGTINAAMAQPEGLPLHHTAPANIKGYLKSNSNIQVRKITNPWFTGDHTKTISIDNKIAYIGGMNFGREYRYDWHDMMVEVRGPIVSTVNHDFDKAWSQHDFWGELSIPKDILKIQKADKPINPDKNYYPIRLLYTSPIKKEIYRAQLEAIKNSSDYIYIQNAYFSDDRILYELVKAKLRGVDVRVLFPSEGNHQAMNRSNRVAINTLLKYGISVYMYPGMTHIKAAIYDGWACFGTANFDKLSFHVNKELNLASSDPQVVQALLEQLFEPDFAKSTRLETPFELKISDYIYEWVSDLAL